MKKCICITLFITLLISMLFFTSCTTEQKQETEYTQTTTSETIKTTSQKSEVKDNTETKTTTNEPEDNSIFNKLRVSCDEVGIYSVSFELNENAVDKGVIEMIYTGAKNTAEEGSIVNRYRVEYYKDTTGKFEISTFYNGNIDQNLHQKDTVKIDCGFGAGVRAGDVTICYTPDGGETEEIFKAEADGKSTAYK